MRIGGFTKQSHIDWHDKLAAVVFTKGCNFRCSFCHNAELVYPELVHKTDDIPEEIVFDFLSTRTTWLDGVVITGGEPTIQHDLKDFIEKIKIIGLAVKLDTNGSSPRVLEELLKSNLLDYVAMDIKTIFDEEAYQTICDINDLQLLSKIKESVEILKQSNIDYQLRTTVVPKYHTKDMINKLQDKFSYCNYKLQEFREIKFSSDM